MLRRGIKLNTELAQRLPEDHEIDFDLGNCYHNLGYLLLKRGHAEEALATLEQAEKVEKSLIEKNPRTPRCRRNLGPSPLARRSPGSAERRVVEPTGKPGNCREATAEFPANVLYQLDLARCFNKVAGELAKAKRADDAERLYEWRWPP